MSTAHLLVRILAVIAIVGFTSLGYWQLGRADYKQNLLQLKSQRENLPPMTPQDESLDELLYRRLEVRGSFMPERSIWIENRRHGNALGFHLITPLRLEGQDAVLLVNRGWIPSPVQGLPAEPMESGSVLLTGEAAPGESPFFRLRNPGGFGAAAAWPYLAIEDFEAWSGLDVLPWVLIRDNSPSLVAAWAMVPPPNPGMHLGYAIQWFSFAAFIVGYWGWAHFKSKRSTGDRG